MPLQFWLSIIELWQVLVTRSITIGENEFVSYSNHVTPEKAEGLERWNEDSDQNIWELSGQFEGDMVLSVDERNGLIGENSRWLNREIPYEIDPTFITVFAANEQRKWIIYSLTEFYNKTCIKPRFRNETDKDYVYVTAKTGGCHSKVGRIGGKQNLNLQPFKSGTGCLRLGTVVHEFLHALGFYHQQSSTNRNNYIRIVWDNIKAEDKRNFEKYSDHRITSFGEKYDYNSVMHYSAYAFSKNGEKTIITLVRIIMQKLARGMASVKLTSLNLTECMAANSANSAHSS